MSNSNGSSTDLINLLVESLLSTKCKNFLSSGKPYPVTEDTWKIGQIPYPGN